VISTTPASLPPTGIGAHVSRQRTFALVAAVPFTVLAAVSVIGAGRAPSGGSAVADPILVVHDAQTPIVAYLAPSDTGAELVTSKYGRAPHWTSISSGSAIIPTPVTRAGDLVFINADPNSGNGEMTVQVSASRDEETQFASCLVAMRLWSSTDDGESWNDVTGLLTDGISGPSELPFYLDCARGQFEMTVPTAEGLGIAHQQYLLSVEPGGSLAPGSDYALLRVAAELVAA